MKYTLGTAAKATGKSRTAILRAIKTGKISALKDENGHYQIDPSELFRVYIAVTGNSTNGVNNAGYEQSVTPDVTPKLIDILERERQQMQATIDDLRRRLDEAEEARKDAAAETRRLTQMLTYQSKTVQEVKQYQKEDSPLWRKLFGRK
jgi:DNA repair ATPase RecN